MKTEDYYNFCLSEYKKAYVKAHDALVKKHGNNDLSVKTKDEFDRE